MITKAALLLFREHAGIRQLMFVKAFNKSFWVLPGGKQEADETIEAALVRELQEELAVDITNIALAGTVQGVTPDGRDLTMHLYSGTVVGEPSPHAEITEMAWLSKQQIIQGEFEMTPMTLGHVVPFLKQAKLL